MSGPHRLSGLGTPQWKATSFWIRVRDFKTTSVFPQEDGGNMRLEFLTRN